MAAAAMAAVMAARWRHGWRDGAAVRAFALARAAPAMAAFETPSAMCEALPQMPKPPAPP